MQKVSFHVFEALSLLRPFDIDREKIRVGRDRDGGYILADMPSLCDVMSFGISDDVAFEKQMAGKGHTVYMYDHTIAGLPEENDRFRYAKIGICAEGEELPDMRPLTRHMAAIPSPTDRMILKVDVEGHEWSVFATTPVEALEKFDQIVIELHWMRNLSEPAFAERAIRALRTLNAQFTLFHVHANNYCELHMVEGFAVADVLEVSYVRTSLIQRRPSETVYPTGLDNPNHPGAADLPLLFYPFLPMRASAHQALEVVKRITFAHAAHP